MSDEKTPRKAMTKARKHRIWLAAGGRCICGADVPMLGPRVTYDHHHQLAMGGPETDDAVRPLCDLCRPIKDRADARARGKVRRIRKKAGLAPGKPADGRSASGAPQDQTLPAPGPTPQRTRRAPAIRSRPFPKGHRPIPKRKDPWRKR